MIMSRRGWAQWRTLTLARKLCLLLLASTAFAGMAALGYVALLALSSQSPGPFYRARFEEVVAEARRLPIPPDDVVELRLDRLSDPRSLRPVRDDEVFGAGEGAGRVWAQRTVDGHMKVVIETQDSGHAGHYGFAFSDVPLKPEPRDDPSNWSRIDVPGHLCIVMPDGKIDEHWWSVLSNME